MAKKGRKKKKAQNENEQKKNISKKIRNAFANMLGSVEKNNTATSGNANSRTQPQQNMLNNWLEEARQNDQRVAENIQPADSKTRGEERSSLSDLKNRDDFVRISAEGYHGINFLIRRGSVTTAPNLHMREINYDVTVSSSAEFDNVSLASFIGAIWDVFDALFTDCLKQSDYDEICFHVTHRELEGSLSTSVFELREDNREKIIYQIMSRLTGWNQSSNPSAAVKHLGIAVTMLKRNLPGQGVLLALGDDNLRKKGFSQQNFNGSIFYVDCEKDCFFVSIYFGMIYNCYMHLFENAKTAVAKQRINQQMYTDFALKGESLEKAARDYFQKLYDIDISQFESGSDCFLRELTLRAGCQVSIFSDAEGYSRVLMIPETYNPLLEHVNILLTQYLKKTEPRKTVRCEREILQYHYHGIRISCRGFVGQKQAFCAFCGVYYSYTSSFGHGCKKNDILCEVCRRPQLDWTFFRDLTKVEKTNFCITNVPASLLGQFSLECNICKKKGKSTLCLEIHSRNSCRDRVRCEKCTRVINLVGKYSPLVCKDAVKCHESCEEVFCTICKDYVDGYEDLKNPSHVCYVPPITKAKTWPSLMVCFDFETYPSDAEGNMRANMVHMIYQEESYNCASDFKGIFFTDVPMEDVKLNGQTVVSGREYIPDLGSELKSYYSYELLASQLAEGDKQLVESGQVLKKLSEKELLIDNNPMDPELCHFLRNPEIADLSVMSSVPSHLDIFQYQTNAIAKPVEEECEKIPHKKRKIDWRDELRRLEEFDKELVDKAKVGFDSMDEEEALLEDELYRKRKLKKENRKKSSKNCPFILEEATEKDDNQEDEEGEGENQEEEKSIPAESLYFKHCIYYPTEMSGDVPGYSCREKNEVLDFQIGEMSKEENVKHLQELCKDPFPHWKNTDTSETQNVKKFCEHETTSSFLKRCATYKKCLSETESNCLKQFCLYILQPKFKNAVFLGMYSSGFDNHFVFTQLIDLGVRVNPVFKGNKLLTFSIPALNIRFLDFFCYVPSSLKNLEKSFNLKTGSKGYFPHLLNKPENYGLELPHLPPKFFYETEMMKSEDLNLFDEWYTKNFDKKFVFRQELLTYCELDVKILAAASLTFVKETLTQQSEFVNKVRKLKSNGQKIFARQRDGSVKSIVPNLIHVFSTDLCTLSSYVNTVFRSFYLKEKTLPMITHDVEETYSTRCSKLELQVLNFYKERKGISDLEFGDRFRGQRRFTVVCPDTAKSRTFYVDGYSPSTKTVFEVLGCVFHGCFECFRPDDKLKQGLENFEACRLTKKRLALLKLHPDVKKICVIRECEWKKKTQTESDVIEFVKHLKNEPLTGRRMSLKETFRGGLVEPFCLAYDVEKVKSIVQTKLGREIPDPYGKLVDINSMYPAQLMPAYSFSERDLDYVMCPINGHTVLRGHKQCLETCNEECDVKCRRLDSHVCEENVTCYQTCNFHHPPSEWSKLPGFALVKILPPKNQRFPILRMTLNTDDTSKNFSTLCRTCAVKGNAFDGLKICQHSDEERSLFGEFSTVELNFALNVQGYRLLEVHEIQFYPSYSLTMFQDLLKSFYMMKVASKGFPVSCSTDSDQETFLRQLRKDCSFGEELKLAHIEMNAPRATVSKLSANALVGKLGQCQNRPNKKIVTQHEEVVAIRNSRYFRISSLKLINARSAVLSYTPLEDRIKPYKYGCVAVPSLVTAHSRIYLTRLAMKFEENNHVVAYCDTDSLLAFASHPDAPNLGSLCQISDRLGCLKVERDGIKKFFSTAAKTYSVETVSGEVTIKAKGFNLLEKLLKDNSQQCLLEKNVVKLFSVLDQNTKPKTTTSVFQKQIKVNPLSMVPALIPHEKSYKILNVIGPRRQIDLSNWLDFSYQRLKESNNNVTQIDTIKPFKPFCTNKSGILFDCKKSNTSWVREFETEKNELYSVQLVPQVKGLLPALPYGFDIENVKMLVSFYNLLK